MTHYSNQQMNGGTRGPQPLRLQSLSERTESTLFQRRRQHAQEAHDHVQPDGIHNGPDGMSNGPGGMGNRQDVRPFPVLQENQDGNFGLVFITWWT